MLELHSAGQQARAFEAAELRAIGEQKLPEELAAMRAVGERLYGLLDGPERRLAGLVANSTLELHFRSSTLGGPAWLAHLPWELLHADGAFLVQRGILPVRVVTFGPQERVQAGAGAPANRPLNVLFMACSPRNVWPVLNFEAEERIILDATENQPLYLVPEETGSVEELFETVRSYEAFDVFHLTGHGDLYNARQYAKYLSRDQQIGEGRPILLTEDEQGLCRLAVAEDVEGAFGDRVPALLFLSGCRTGELPEQSEKAHASLAQDLLARGFRGVVGWARPVLDVSATEAAAHFYGQLSAGATIEQALRHCFRELTKPGSGGQPFRIPDWHLLRLFAGDGHFTTALVTPRGQAGRKPFVKPRLDEGFLDKEKKIKVAGFRRFVGRRRALQRTLPALAAESRHTGVAVWGMGGLGKSSLAARLCDRVERLNQQFRRAVLVGVVNETRLLDLVREKYQDHEDALGYLEKPGLKLQGKLQKFFAEVDEAAPLLLVLDDFEDNIELDGGAADAFRLSRDGFETLRAIGCAIRETRTRSRLIVTTRYWSESTFPQIDLLAEQLPQMDRDELRKKARNELEPGAKGERSEQIVRSAAGNPRLFETLARDAGKEGQAPDEQQTKKFREGLELAKVLETLSEEGRRQLARLSVFQLPVSPAMALEVTGDGEFRRAVSLGLVEGRSAGDQPQLRVTDVVRPLLESELSESEYSGCCASAARAAHKTWWAEAERSSEAQRIEIVRLATWGGEREIACDLMERLAAYWNNGDRYRETLRWGSFVLERFEDYRLLTSVAVAERFLGETGSASQHLERALVLQPEDDERERVFALHEAAKLREQQGDLKGALDLYRQASEIAERIGYEAGKGATLHAMAGLRQRQGDVDGALACYREALDIAERVGDASGKALTLHGMATLQGERDADGALGLYRKALEIEERIGDLRAKAATLHQMARVHLKLEELGTARALYHESLEIEERIGNAHGKAMTLLNLGELAHLQGDMPSAAHHTEQAARTLAEIRAWPDLIIALGSLALCDPERRTYWLTQASWLALALLQPQPASLSRVAGLFHALPKGDPLELPLAALAYLLFTNSGPETVQSANREKAAKLLDIAGGNQSMNQEELLGWLKEKAGDLGKLYRDTLAALEALAPEPWIFDRQAVLESLAGATNEAETE